MNPPPTTASHLTKRLHLLSTSRAIATAMTLVVIAFFCTAPLPLLRSKAQTKQQPAVDQPTARSNAWILEQGSRKGYRVSDLAAADGIDAKRTDANQTQIAQSNKSQGRFASFDPPGYSPAQIRRAYGFDKLKNDGKGQVIAIVSAFHSPTSGADLQKFSKTFGLRKIHDNGTLDCAAPGVRHPCFQVMYASSFQPPVDTGWGLESAIDTQWAHAIAPGADIILVEAASNNLADLHLAVAFATSVPRVSVISMSWGTFEFAGEQGFDVFFNAPGVTYLASAGDTGGIPVYPAASPFVIAVGGTTLRLDRKGNRTAETAWINGGGGPSAFSFEPAYQMDYPIPFTNNKKGTPDVAMVGDVLTGTSVYSSLGFGGQTGWFEAGGTSLSAPLWAGLIALANELRRGQNLTSTDLFNSPIYDAARRDYRDNFFDIRSGSAGAFTATRGYDFTTGLGSPRADELVKALAGRRRD